MNIDQRLDRLTERHEALTQSLELLAAMHKDLEQQTAQRFDKLTALMAETGQFINQLAHIAAAHEHRLDHLEGQQ